MIVQMWLARRKWSWTPQSFQNWQDSVITNYLLETYAPRVEAAQRDGVGIEQAWAAPGTGHDELLTWLDEHLRSIPGALGGTDQVRVMLVRCSQEEFEYPDQQVLPSERLLGMWEGACADWWFAGRDAMSSVLPTPIDGVAVMVNQVSAAFLAALDPHYGAR